MKTLIAITLFLITGCGNNQSVISKHVEGARTDKDGNCFINTSGLPKANGMDMDVYYPCSWVEMHVKDHLPAVIKDVGIMLEGINANLALTLMISKLRDTLTPKLLDQVRVEMYLKDKSKVEGTVYADTLEIDGVKGGEIITKNVLESGQIAYILNIQLYSNDNLIQLIYSVGAPTEDEASSVFEKQKPIFMALAKRTEFHNKS